MGAWGRRRRRCCRRDQRQRGEARRARARRAGDDTAAARRRRLKPSFGGTIKRLVAAVLLHERREDLRRGSGPSAMNLRITAICSASPWQFGMPHSRQRPAAAARAHDVARRTRPLAARVNTAAPGAMRAHVPTPSSISRMSPTVAPLLATAGALAAAKANVDSGSSAMSVPSASTPKPIQTQLTSGLTTSSTVADCSPRSNAGQHEVDVLGERRGGSPLRWSAGPRASGRTTSPDTSSPSSCAVLAATVTCAVTICFWPSSVTRSASSRAVDVADLDRLTRLQEQLSPSA